jgi:hypothetical protein
LELSKCLQGTLKDINLSFRKEIMMAFSRNFYNDYVSCIEDK